MGIGRKALLAGASLVLPASMVVAFAAPASAGGTVYTGPASGSVSCTGVNWKITFPGGLHAASGPAAASIKGTLSGCTATGTINGSAESIQQGKVTGTMNGTSSGANALLLGTTDPTTLTIVWKGKVGTGKAKFDNSSVTFPNGAASVTVPNVGFNLGGGAGGTVSGSFAGSITSQSSIFTTVPATTLATQLGSKHGIKKISFTQGTLAIP